MPFKLPVSMEVSTHSRLKAAGDGSMTPAVRLDIVSTHSRLKAAGDGSMTPAVRLDIVSTHSRLKAAGATASLLTI